MRLAGFPAPTISFWLRVSRMGARAPLWQPAVLCVFLVGLWETDICAMCVYVLLVLIGEWVRQGERIHLCLLQDKRFS